MRGLSRGGDILIKECGRDAERGGDVPEALDFDLGRQEFLGIELDAQQIADGRRELGPRQALDRYMSRLRLTASARQAGDIDLLGSIERRFHPRRERVDVALIRLAVP